MSEILLGTCGWSYAEWEGILYPQKQSKLKQYSSIFPTAEIDSTFYSLPKREIVLGWARSTPPLKRSNMRLFTAVNMKQACPNQVTSTKTHYLEVHIEKSAFTHDRSEIITCRRCHSPKL